MAAGRYDFTLEQGTTFRRTFRWRQPDGVTPKDLTGWTAKMQIRPKPGQPEALTLSTDAPGGITINGAAGEVTVTILPAQSSAITIRRGVYDLELTSPGGEVFRLIEGTVTVSPEVTV